MEPSISVQMVASYMVKGYRFKVSWLKLVGAIPESGDLSDINIPIGKTGAAVETTKISLTGNLNSNVEVANGLNLAANSNTINSNEALKKYLGGCTRCCCKYWCR